ncbi:MAG: alpha/beta family hydrolase [bacterium]
MKAHPEKVLIILERDSYEKDTQLLNRLITALAPSGYTPIWYNPHGVGSSQLVTSHPFVNALPRWLRILIKALLLMRHPSRLGHYLSNDAWRESTIEGRCINLKKFIGTFSPETEIAIFSRSAGGRIASIITDSTAIRKIICLGYPFKHPDQPDEPSRYRHLAQLQTPLLIIQGSRDVYGGYGIRNNYRLSPAVELDFIDTDHDFKLNNEQFIWVVNRIVRFLK